ncbi:MAG: transposase, partial [Nitrospirota bacterium]
MNVDSHLRRRRSIRLRGYDYTQSGVYFITICTQNRECLFGNIVDGEMRLNDAGRIVEKWCLELNQKFPNVDTDEYRVMPNHFHGIIPITGSVGADLCVGPNAGEHIGSPLHTVVQWFKTMTTNEYIRGVKQWGWPPFLGKLWQRNYYEHIIRDEKSLQGIREY